MKTRRLNVYSVGYSELGKTRDKNFFQRVMKRWLFAGDLTLRGAGPVQPGGGEGSLTPVTSAASTGPRRPLLCGFPSAEQGGAVTSPVQLVLSSLLPWCSGHSGDRVRHSHKHTGRTFPKPSSKKEIKAEMVEGPRSPPRPPVPSQPCPPTRMGSRSSTVTAAP